MDKVKVWVTKFKSRKKGFIYKVQWFDPRTGKLKTESCGRDRALAKTVAAKRRQELQDGVYREIKPIGWADFVEEHLDCIAANQELTRENHRQAELALRQFEQVCEPKGPADIDYVMLEKFRNARATEGAAPGTVRKGLAYIRSALNAAVLRGYMKHNPYDARLEQRGVEKEANPILLEDFRKILEICPDNQWRALCTIGFYTGLREMEIATLEWSDIDLDNKIILIRSKPENRIKARKERRVAMTAEIVKALEALKLERDIKQLKTGRETRWIFPAVKLLGRPMPQSYVGHRFVKLVKAAGLIGADGEHIYTFHCLRASYVTYALNAGVGAQIVVGTVGHSKFDVTLKHYAGKNDKQMIEAAEKLSRHVSGA